MLDPEIPVTMQAAMVRLQKSVASGFLFYVHGEVPASKIEKLVYTLDERFSLQATDGQRDHARKHGRCTFRLHVFPIPYRKDFAFWLVRNAGDHPLLATERWRDSREDPIRWTFWYELRQLPVPSALREKYKRPDQHFAINATTWTWRIRRDVMDHARFNIRRWVEQRDERLTRLIRSLAYAPGRRGIRHDVHELHRYILAQCRKRGAAPPPPLPVIRWSTGTGGRTVPLSYLLTRWRRGADTWFPQSLQRRDTVHEPIALDVPHQRLENSDAASQTGSEGPPQTHG